MEIFYIHTVNDIFSCGPVRALFSRAHRPCWPGLGLWPPRPRGGLAGSPGEQRGRRGERLLRAAPGSQQRSLVCRSARERACHHLLTVQDGLTESVLANSGAPSPSVASRGSFSLRVLPARSPRWGGGSLDCFRGGRSPRGAPRAGRRVRLLSLLELAAHPQNTKPFLPSPPPRGRVVRRCPCPSALLQSAFSENSETVSRLAPALWYSVFNYLVFGFNR